MSENLNTAESHWSVPLPDWLEALARDCDNHNQTHVARRLKVSSSVISQVLKGKYPGNMDRFIDKARGVYLSAKITCPVVGEISLDRCHNEQANPTRTSSPVRAALYRSCRSGQCPHAKINQSKTRSLNHDNHS